MTEARGLQRYRYKPGVYDLNLKGFRPDMDPHIDGDWIRFIDVDAALREARAEGVEEVQRQVQTVCNAEVLCYNQDKQGVNHPDVEGRHNGNAARVADTMRIWCRQRAAALRGGGG